MNGRISKLISRYCMALANNEETKSHNYKDRLQRVVKKAWNNTPSNERGKLRVRMERVINEYKKQLEKSNERRGSG